MLNWFRSFFRKELHDIVADFHKVINRIDALVEHKNSETKVLTSQRTAIDQKITTNDATVTQALAVRANVANILNV